MRGNYSRRPRERHLSHANENNLQVIKQIWLCICSAAIFSIRCWFVGGFQCTKDVVNADPELLYCVNERINGAGYEYVEDCNVFMSLMEVHFPRTTLSTKVHSVVCRAKCEMEMMGALRMELGIERTVSYYSLLSIIVCLIT